MATFILYSGAGGSGTLSIDATLVRETSKAVEVTKFPIEDGSVVSDHAIKAPDTYRLEGLISNTPTVPPSAMETGLYDSSAQDGRDRLESIFDAKQPVTISTPKKTLEDMIMVSLSFPEDPTTGDALRFSAAFEKIVRVTTQTVKIPKSSKPGKVDGGKKPTEKASEPVKRKTSTTVDIVDFLK